MDCVAKNKKEAIALGQKTYFTGVPCKRGLIAHRRLNGDCLCERCVNIAKEMKSAWAKNNRDVLNAWRKNNPSKMAQYKINWAIRNKEKSKSNIAKWKSQNKHKILAYTEKRRARKVNSVPPWYSDFDEFVMQEAIHLARVRQKATGINWSMDHMIPLQAKMACGLHCADNIQVIPSALNYAKSNRMKFTRPLEWIKDI